MNQSIENEEVEDKNIRFIEKNISWKTLECFKMNKTGILEEIRDENLFYFWLKTTSKENSTQENSSLNNQEIIVEMIIKILIKKTIKIFI